MALVLANVLVVQVIDGLAASFSGGPWAVTTMASQAGRLETRMTTSLDRLMLRRRSWQRRKSARPGEILEAALVVFAQKGYAAARMEDIAACAGITKGTIYLYFASKDDLLKTLSCEQEPASQHSESCQHA